MATDPIPSRFALPVVGKEVRIHPGIAPASPGRSGKGVFGEEN